MPRWTPLLVPALALMLLNWNMTCSRGHALFHAEEHDHVADAHAPHHHGPAEHTHHTEPGDPDHTVYKPIANRQPATWRADLSLVLQSSAHDVGTSALVVALDEGRRVSRANPDRAVPPRGGGQRLILQTARWLA